MLLITSCFRTFKSNIPMLQYDKMDCSLAIFSNIHNKQETFFFIIKTLFKNTAETFN